MRRGGSCERISSDSYSNALPSTSSTLHLSNLSFPSFIQLFFSFPSSVSQKRGSCTQRGRSGRCSKLEGAWTLSLNCPPPAPPTPFTQSMTHLHTHTHMASALFHSISELIFYFTISSLSPECWLTEPFKIKQTELM